MSSSVVSSAHLRFVFKALKIRAKNRSWLYFLCFLDRCFCMAANGIREELSVSKRFRLCSYSVVTRLFPSLLRARGYGEPENEARLLPGVSQSLLLFFSEKERSTAAVPTGIAKHTFVRIL